jgi:hypothetical protein
MFSFSLIIYSRKKNKDAGTFFLQDYQTKYETLARSLDDFSACPTSKMLAHYCKRHDMGTKRRTWSK